MMMSHVLVQEKRGYVVETEGLSSQEHTTMDAIVKGAGHLIAGLDDHVILMRVARGIHSIVTSGWLRPIDLTLEIRPFSLIPSAGEEARNQ